MRLLKRALGSVLRLPWINRPARAALAPFVAGVPVERLARVPFTGTVRVALPRGRTLALESSGRDLIASALAWRGLRGWEPETVAVIERLLPEVRGFADVGASTGFFALLAALDDPTREVWAFEPSPPTARALARNLVVNGVANVRLVEVALGATDGEARLYVPPGESLPLGASTLPRFRAPGAAVPVALRRLDTVVKEHDMARVDLLKLDTEGTEPAVLEGARELLLRDEPWIVCEVLHGLTEAALHAVLDPLGYRYFALTDAGPAERVRIVGDPTYRERNWLFATARRAAAVQSMRTILATERAPSPVSTAK